MINNRRPRSDSLESNVREIATRERDIPLPEGVTLASDEERTLWRQFCHVRKAEDWRDFDLVLLAKVVHLEAELRRYQAVLDKSGALIKNDRGTLVENPLVRVIDTMQRQQLSVIRAMSLNASKSDLRTLNDAGRAASKRDRRMEDMDTLNLLAV